MSETATTQTAAVEVFFPKNNVHRSHTYVGADGFTESRGNLIILKGLQEVAIYRDWYSARVIKAEGARS